MPFLSERNSPGNTLFVQHVDHLARIQPDKPFVSFPRTDTLSDGFRDITWGVFGNAVSRAAHWMDTLPSKRCDFETLAYFGDSDIRYFILVLAANKTGYKVSGLQAS
jgi:acyl-CoA synthetase (AMP-forming)/AMP-acid ligase II